MYIYHKQNVKSNKKFNETAQTANFTDWHWMAEHDMQNCSRVFFSERFLIFANIAKISDSVDFEQP